MATGFHKEEGAPTRIHLGAPNFQTFLRGDVRTPPPPQENFMYETPGPNSEYYKGTICLK